MNDVWTPTFGAWPEPDGVRFRVWAPAARRVELFVERAAGPPVAQSLDALGDGTHTICLAEVTAGDRYRYLLDGKGPFPDPASRFQPDGVHGASEVIDAGRYHWQDAGWRGVATPGLVLYELHVGTFTPEGTFAAAAGRLPYLRDLGVTAIELMPVADFPGDRNWGYDGAALFAPARCYGRPDDLRRLVDAAHAAGLGVFLDVVYNHLGPDGAYLAAFCPAFFSKRHRSPWGAGVNLDGPGSDTVRRFLIDNALHWVHEYHVDGLRLDATHALVDESPRHFLAELAAAGHGAREPRVLVIAEDDRNLATIVRPDAEGGWGLDGVWADDFHHQTRRILAGDCDGYYRDFTGSVADLATIVRDGWLYRGQYAAHFGGPRGTPPDGIPLEKFVCCLQNHDQIGNRAFGDRLHHQIDPAAYRAAVALLLFVPETPLLFMGQEWAASSSFLYFTAHGPDLGRQVTEGRRREFAAFSAFSHPAARTRIPDPQAVETFQRSRLDWRELETEPHTSVLRLYRRLLGLRRTDPVLRDVDRNALHVSVLDEDTLGVRRDAGERSLAAIVRLRGAGTVTADRLLHRTHPVAPQAAASWALVLTTEDPPFATDPAPPVFDPAPSGTTVTFHRPSAILLGLI